ncbi:hypothetical protein PSTG_07827 [Puccinia striiformis f. sp. tritici PST-78]|uniref:Uncharacterized protein n=1 Tax=Puccinia striiformis f. sp. tritici PST-78 TaxID=1165861 RepID=A0A0L0VIA6_9BASI|nr:hypothetical protein PSTG_07827 [Puccinia striiformis f. sp. tritici PST-78]
MQLVHLAQWWSGCDMGTPDCGRSKFATTKIAKMDPQDPGKKVCLALKSLTLLLWAQCDQYGVDSGVRMQTGRVGPPGTRGCGGLGQSCWKSAPTRGGCWGGYGLCFPTQTRPVCILTLEFPRAHMDLPEGIGTCIKFGALHGLILRAPVVCPTQLVNGQDFGQVISIVTCPV